METVYIETTIVSYLVANPSRDLIVAAHQQSTQRWWNEQRQRYECVTSDEVLREATQGDATMAQRRIDALADLTLLEADEPARRIALEILKDQILPPNAIADATHLATASRHGIDILLTWNCRHLANPHLLRRLREFMQRRGLTLPEVCTPIELAGE
jgi:predicted nucleic acid-binding protein